MHADRFQDRDREVVAMMPSRRNGGPVHRLEEKYDEVNQLIAVGKEKGYLDCEDMTEILPDELATSDEYDELAQAAIALPSNSLYECDRLANGQRFQVESGGPERSFHGHVDEIPVVDEPEIGSS